MSDPNDRSVSPDIFFDTRLVRRDRSLVSFFPSVHITCSSLLSVSISIFPSFVQTSRIVADGRFRSMFGSILRGWCGAFVSLCSSLHENGLFASFDWPRSIDRTRSTAVGKQSQWIEAILDDLLLASRRRETSLGLRTETARIQAIRVRCELLLGEEL